MAGGSTQTTDSITFLDALVEAVSRAGQYNKNDQVPPAVVLWPDGDRQWLPLLPRLRERLTLLTFDPDGYDPAALRGPAYWIRCMIAGTLPDAALPAGRPPVIYLPGVSRADLRAVEEFAAGAAAAGRAAIPRDAVDAAQQPRLDGRRLLAGGRRRPRGRSRRRRGDARRPGARAAPAGRRAGARPAQGGAPARALLRRAAQPRRDPQPAALARQSARLPAGDRSRALGGIRRPQPAQVRLPPRGGWSRHRRRPARRPRRGVGAGLAPLRRGPGALSPSAGAPSRGALVELPLPVCRGRELAAGQRGGRDAAARGAAGAAQRAAGRGARRRGRPGGGARQAPDVGVGAPRPGAARGGPRPARRPGRGHRGAARRGHARRPGRRLHGARLAGRRRGARRAGRRRPAGRRARGHGRGDGRL